MEWESSSNGDYEDLKIGCQVCLATPSFTFWVTPGFSGTLKYSGPWDPILSASLEFFLQHIVDNRLIDFPALRHFDLSPWHCMETGTVICVGNSGGPLPSAA